MFRRSSLSLSKLLHRNLIGRSPRPKSQFPAETLTAHSNRREFHQFSRPRIADSAARSNAPNNWRRFSGETDREVDKINLKFAEAREEIESALDSKETVYFNEEAECAREAVGEVLELYEGLLRRLPESERASIQRAMGLKIEQLKAELLQLNE